MEPRTSKAEPDAPEWVGARQLLRSDLTGKDGAMPGTVQGLRARASYLSIFWLLMRRCSSYQSWLLPFEAHLCVLPWGHFHRPLSPFSLHHTSGFLFLFLHWTSYPTPLWSPSFVLSHAHLVCGCVWMRVCVHACMCLVSLGLCPWFPASLRHRLKVLKRSLLYLSAPLCF